MQCDAKVARPTYRHGSDAAINHQFSDTTRTKRSDNWPLWQRLSLRYAARRECSSSTAAAERRCWAGHDDEETDGPALVAAGAAIVIPGRLPCPFRTGNQQNTTPVSIQLASTAQVSALLLGLSKSLLFLDNTRLLALFASANYSQCVRVINPLKGREWMSTGYILPSTCNLHF